jgi:ketosteroid isomerase-like protein
MAKYAYTIGAAIAAVSLATLSVPSTANAHDVAAEIEKVRQATAKYNDVNVALAAGYVPAPPGDCVTAAKEGLPAAWGGMGIHYINPGMLKIKGTQPKVTGDATHTDFMNPSILLYEPQADGTMKLVGVENLVFLHAWQKSGKQAPPKFAGRSYDTMADNAGTEHDEAHNFEPHMDQHVYFAKSANPSDQLRPFHPSVTCEHFKPVAAQMPADSHPSAASMTEEVLGKHLTAFGSGNVDAILANYAEDAVIMVPGATMRGHKDIRPMFEGLVAEFGQPGVTFEMLNQDVDGDVALIVWKAETGKAIYELGTDTFIIHDGKIVQQTVAAKVTNK